MLFIISIYTHDYFHVKEEPPCPQTQVIEDAKYGSLLANLQERVVQTDQGMVVLSSQMSPSSSVNTGSLNHSNALLRVFISSDW